MLLAINVDNEKAECGTYAGQEFCHVACHVPI